MPERTPSEQLWADLERQLLAMPHEHLAKVCAHLIRTYIIESRSTAHATTAPVVPAPSEQNQPAANVVAQSTPTAARTPERGPAPAQSEPKRSKNAEDKKYNKLEMD